MTLWTIQHEKAFETLERDGILTANENHLCCDDDFRFAYDWLVDKMKCKIGTPPQDIKYPIWAWYMWEGKRKRCDLRYGGYAERGTPLVQLEIEIPDNEVVLSNFDDWHIVIMHGFCSDSIEEWDSYYNSIKNIPEEELWFNPQYKNLRDQVIESWNKIFDVCPYDLHPNIQATFWYLKKEQVKRVEHFIAK